VKLLAAVLLVTTVAVSQTPNQKSSPEVLSLENLRARYTLALKTISIFGSSYPKMSFFVTSSWIPDTGSLGKLRYDVLITAVPNGGSILPFYLDKLHGCSLTMRLNDEGDFELATVPLSPLKIVDDDGTTKALDDNASTPMDRDSYMHLRNATNPVQILFNCPPLVAK